MFLTSDRIDKIYIVQLGQWVGPMMRLIKLGILLGKGYTSVIKDTGIYCAADFYDINHRTGV